MVKLKDIFHIEYGNQVDLNKLKVSNSTNGIRFISRSSTDLGFQCYVEPLANLKKYNKGDITVTLGGTYLLSSFVQPAPFYTAQNIKVLSPKIKLKEIEKRFYCYAISCNRFRFTSHGREANKTLNDMLVPSIEDIPKWIYKDLGIREPSERSVHNKMISLDDRNWELFNLGELFHVIYGVNLELNKMVIDSKGIPFVSRKSLNNGVSAHVKYYKDIKPNPANTISVSGGGSVLECFYQDKEFYSGRDLFYLKPKTEISSYSMFFICTIIRQEKYRFNYGRQANKSLPFLKIKLPITKDGQPDWQFMEYYIKSLPYSSNLKEDKKEKKGLTDAELIEKYESGSIDLGKKLKTAINKILRS